MSSHESESWLERWWPLFLILFGVTCVLFLACFKPMS
jgi:hypothetical protein